MLDNLARLLSGSMAIPDKFGPVDAKFYSYSRQVLQNNKKYSEQTDKSV